MRILVISPCVPWPLNCGGNAAQFSTLRAMVRDHEFTLLTLVWGKSDALAAETLGRELPEIRVRTVPYPGVEKRGAIERAVRAIARRVRRTDAGPESAGLPSYPFGPLPEPLIKAVEEELGRRPDLCQVEYAELLALGPWLPRSLPKVFLHLQLHFIYAQRTMAVNGWNSYSDYLYSHIRCQELAFLRCFNTVVTFCEEDSIALRPFLPGTRVLTSPFPIPADVGIAASLPQFSGPKFVFVGSQGHPPNQDALLWLKGELWPRIRGALPAAELDIVGDWKEHTRAMFPNQGVRFVGFVPDLPQVIRGRIMLVPIRIGSGIRTKILAALAQGVPVVSTTVGCEGLAVDAGRDILRVDDAVAFSNAAVRLAQNEKLWQELASAGLQVAREKYAPEAVRVRRNWIYQETLNRCALDSAETTSRGVSKDELANSAV